MPIPIAPRKIDVPSVRRALHRGIAARAPKLHAPEGAESGLARPTGATGADGVGAAGVGAAHVGASGVDTDGVDRVSHGAGDARQLVQLVVLGESTALGIGCDEPSQILAAQLAQVLADREGRDMAWRTLAADGATADYCTLHLVPRLEAEAEAGRAPVDVVVIAIGVNDLLRGHRPGRFARDVEALVNRTRAVAPDAAIVISGLPEPRSMPLLPRPVASLLSIAAGRLDGVFADAARRHRLTFVPIRQLPLGVEHLAADKFHPGPAGCGAWAEELARAIGPA